MELPYAFSVSDAARHAGISRALLYELIREGRIKSVKVRDRRLILRADLEGFLASCGEAA